MNGFAPLILLLLLFQGSSAPAYMRAGDRVEQQLRDHRAELNQFLDGLRQVIVQYSTPAQAKPLLQQLQDTPPEPGIFGYQMLPQITSPQLSPKPVTSFSYSWAITEGYISGERAKLARTLAKVKRLNEAAPVSRPTLLSGLVRDYRELVSNHRTIDQYIQYNRFWQRSIALDRSRFDQLTALYEQMRSGDSDTSDAIRKVLGTPRAPDFIRVERSGNSTVLRIPVNTDIQNPAYIAQVENVVEKFWTASDDSGHYSVDLQFRILSPDRVYAGSTAPQVGARVDISSHAARFPNGAGILTTGAEFTHASVGRYVALGPGALAPRTLAHEFGHLFGFTDGYIRGYRDLGEEGFEILELTSFFDDIMSAPREGNVQATHFRLLLAALR